jgi:hypothetical protein
MAEQNQRQHPMVLSVAISPLCGCRTHHSHAALARVRNIAQCVRTLTSCEAT